MILKRFRADEEEGKVFKFNLFGEGINDQKDASTLTLGRGQKCFNFTTERGILGCGMGISDFAMPQNYDDLENDVVIPVYGTQVKTLWKLKWFNNITDNDRYYLFYFNDEGYACFDDLFQDRMMTNLIPTNFTQTPYATYYRKGEQDAILLSGEGDNLMIVTGSGTTTSDTAPRIINCCRHYDKVFAITADARGSLIYNEDSDILNWTDEKTKNLDFHDERGDLNKIISFNDYLYIFRDFGITEISEYGSDEEFAISHIYQSTAHIEPDSIAQAGDKIYFLEGCEIKAFNGSSVKTLDLDCLGILKGQNQHHAFGACLDGKYYLACRGDFGDGKKVGCEGSESGYFNNVLLCLDIDSGHVDILRGVDINEMIALTNKYKSKIAICFYHDNIGKLGQITNDGLVFGERFESLWQSGVTDFGKPMTIKNVQKLSIQSEGDLTFTISSDMGERKLSVKGGQSVQEFFVNLLGRQFEIKIEAQNAGSVSIGKMSLAVCFKQ